MEDEGYRIKGKRNRRQIFQVSAFSLFEENRLNFPG
jgi:hypothetical protein